MSTVPGRRGTPESPSAPAEKREPDLHDTQRDALARLSRAGDVRSVLLLSVTLVTDSVQVLVQIHENNRRSYYAVIAPSGRIHRL